MPFIESVNSKANVKQFTNNDLPFAPQQPVINSYYAVSTAAQTSIANLGFSIDTVNNPDVFFLFLDGKKLRLGASNDYQFAAIGADGTSSAITFNVAIPAGLNIQAYKLGLKPEIQFLMDNRFTQLYAAQNSGFQAFISQTDFTIAATTTTGTPASGTFYSSIANRASIPDLSQDLKARMGVERMMIESVSLNPTEFGPNGEQVYVAQNDPYGQIRYIGVWSNQPGQLGNGATIFPAANQSSAEVTFYGTGLSILAEALGTAETITLTVDGVSASAPTLAASPTFMATRGYATNQIFKLVSGLTLGIHTVKVSWTTANWNYYGWEILNESSSIQVNPGIGYNQGQKLVSASASTFAYNSSVVGTTGGRVLVYQTAAGAIASAFTQNATSPTYLTNGSNAGNDIARTIFWREFGVGRSDDFSYNFTSGTGFQKAYTLDDGTTTLSCNNCTFDTSQSATGLYASISGSTSWVAITFVGTGLDIMAGSGVSSGSASMDMAIYVDGVSRGNISALTNQPEKYSIASGLPYGTHTVKILANNAGGGGGNNFVFYSAVIYQPKKPTLPAGAIELADYNVLGNYIANTTGGQTSGNVTFPIATGVLRKAIPVREAVYSGTSWSVGQDVNTCVGWNTTAGSNSGYSVSYTFFGTGFDFRFEASGSSENFTVSIDGSSNLSSFTSSAYGTGVSSFTASTGVVVTNAGTNYGNGVQVSGLALGVHTVKITNNNTNGLQPEAMDIITPIHSYKANLYQDIANASMVGSNSISDNRNATPLRQPQSLAKFRGYMPQAQNPTTTSTTYVPIAGQGMSFKSQGSWFELSTSQVINSNNNQYVAIFVNGIQITTDQQTEGGSSFQVSNSITAYFPPGVYYAAVYWKGISGQTLSYYQTPNQGYLAIKEL